MISADSSALFTLSSKPDASESNFNTVPSVTKPELFDLSKILNTPCQTLYKYRKQIAFRETLVISCCPHSNIIGSITNANLKSIGGLIIDIQLTGPKYQNFIVFVSSQFLYNQRNAGSHITSCVLSNLHTVEEKRVEFIKADLDFVNEKQLYVALQSDNYYVNSHSRLETSIVKQFYGFNKSKNLVLEGASFILLRYLALIRYIGQFEMSTLYINGDICQNIYSSTGPESAIINNVKCDIIRIHRIIKEKCGIVHYSVTTLLLSGYLVREEWEHTSVVMHLNPLIQIEPVDLKTPSAVLKNYIPTFYEWQDDMQLFSRYLDFKTKRLAIHKNYYADHPEIKSLISDYCQSVLIQKPDDILDFTINYFQTFSKQILPFSTYFAHKHY